MTGRWPMVRGADLFDYVRGVSFSPAVVSRAERPGDVAVLRAGSFGWGQITRSDLLFVPGEYVRPEQKLRPGDLVISMSSGSEATLGKTAPVTAEMANTAVGAFCGVLRPKRAEHAPWLRWYLQSPAYRGWLRSLASGTNISNLKRSALMGLPVPLPPLDQQRSVIGRIEALIEGSRRAHAHLLKAEAESATLRRSVLKFAVNGAWPRVPLARLMHKIVDGAHERPAYQESGIPFLSVKDIRDGEIHFEDCKFISPESHSDLIKRCHPEPGDILITKSGTIGRTAVIRTDRPFSLFVSVALLKPRAPDVLPDWVALALEAWAGSISVTADIKGSSLKNLHLADLRALTIPLPPLADQRSILAEVERLLRAARTVDGIISTSFAQLREMEQAILHDAFQH